MAIRKGPKRQKKFLQNWGSLPSELLDSIFESLPSIHDYIQFSLVCKHWRKIALNQKEQRLRSSHNQLAPLLLLKPIKNSSNQRRDQRRALYSVTQGKVVHSFNLSNHRVEKDTCWLCGSSHGWLAYADASFTVTLVNPFTRGTIRLPQVMKVGKSRPECGSEVQISKVVLSANPCLSPNDYEVLIIFDNDDQITKELAHFKSGDNSWTPCDKRMIEGLDIIDATYYKDLFVALTGFDSEPNHGVKVHPSIKCISHPDEIFYHKTSFLVKSTCEDLLLVNTSTDKKSFVTDASLDGTRIFKLESSTGEVPKWVEMESFGTDALFLDNMNAICVSASYSGCLPNSINLKKGAVNLISEKRTRRGVLPEEVQPITWIAPTMTFSLYPTCLKLRG